MESNLIPSMKETLFDPVASNMDEALGEIAEVSLDAILEDGILKEIPVFGTVLALCKTGLNLREKNFIKQTAQFITEFNKGCIDQEKYKQYKKSLENDPKKAEKELGRVILLLDRMIEDTQSKVLGAFYRGYVAGEIKWEKFCELSEVNSRMFIIDYSLLVSICKKPIREDEGVSDEKLYQIRRLIALGLVMEQGTRLYGGNIIAYPKNDYRFIASKLGGTFFSMLSDLKNDI